MSARTILISGNVAELIRAGKYDPSQVHRMTTTEAKDLCAAADICVSARSTKVLCIKPTAITTSFKSKYTVHAVYFSVFVVELCKVYS